MTLIETITKQLNSYPNFKKQARIGYFEDVPLKQVHIDTMFWQVTNASDKPKIPILCIVDVATRFTHYRVQTKKSENIKGFLSDFIDDVRTKWPQTSEEMILVTDGAPEFKSLSGENNGVEIKTHLSKGINKAVLAEVSVRKARAILREMETAMNVNNIEKGGNQRIDESNIVKIFSIIQDQVNKKAKIRKRKASVKFTPSKFNLGDPVFALNFYKFYPHQLKSNMTKQSYKLNWYYEPFKVVKTYLINGVNKYTLASYTDGKELKYYFYDDQLQNIDKRYVSTYISAFLKNHEKFE